MRELLIIVAGLCIAAGVVLPMLNISRSAQRRIYWSCTALATLAGFLMGYPDLNKAASLAALFLFAMTVSAYVCTPYLKIGGHIYALTVSDRQPDPEGSPTTDDRHPGQPHTSTAPTAASPTDPAPDSYSGLLTPTTLWWLLVVLGVIAAGNTYAFVFSNGQAAPAAVSAAFLALLAAGAGVGDASWGYRIARGQHLPFGVVSLLTAGGFALVYLIAYHIARRFPLRRQQSLEYRAHPRHRHGRP